MAIDWTINGNCIRTLALRAEAARRRRLIFDVARDLPQAEVHEIEGASRSIQEDAHELVLPNLVELFSLRPGLSVGTRRTRSAGPPSTGSHPPWRRPRPARRAR